MPKVFLTAAQREADRQKNRQKNFNLILLERKAEGLTHQRIAAGLGVTTATISGWKQDFSSMSLRNFNRLAELANLSDKEVLQLVRGKMQ